jgi:hypothetical protein
MYRCPQCKGIDLEVAVTCWAALLQDGPDAFETDTDSPDDGSHEFDGKSSAKCNGCSHTAKLDKFESPDWARCNGSDANGVECPEILEQGQDYFSSPCGTYCEPHMQEHAKHCEICAKEFGLPFGEDQTTCDMHPEGCPERCGVEKETNA